jgi:hypothetical protein
LHQNLKGPFYRFDFFDIALDYGDGPYIHPDRPTPITIRIYNTYKVQARLRAHWYIPEGWKITPAGDFQVFSFPAHLGEPNELTFQWPDRMAKHSAG